MKSDGDIELVGDVHSRALYISVMFSIKMNFRVFNAFSVNARVFKVNSHPVTVSRSIVTI